MGTFDEAFDALHEQFGQERVAREPVWEALKTLSQLDPERYEDQVLEYLSMKAAQLPKPLRDLRSMDELTEATEVLAWPCFSLDLSRTHFTSDELEALVQSPLLRAVHTLLLEGCGLGDEGVQVLASSPHLNGLERLDLSSNGIEEDGVRALLGAPAQLPNLRSLTLAENPLALKGAEALAQCEGLSRLESLNLNHCTLYRYEGMRALASSPHVRNLRKLELVGNDINDKGARALAKSPHLGNLRFLDIRTTEIGAKGLEALETSANLPYVSIDYEEW